jgi:hypothetical protein
MLREAAAPYARRVTLAGSALGWVLAAHAAQRLSALTLLEKELWLARLARTLPRLSGLTTAQASRAITAASRRVPGTRCLAWSLALRGLLTQAGVASTLLIGVAAPRPGRFEAHAWVESGGQSWSFGVDVDAYSVLRPRAAAG